MIDGIKITGLKEVRQLLKSVQGESLDILVAGMNKGIARGRALTIKQIEAEVNLTKKEISSTIRAKKVNKDGTGHGYIQCKNKKGWPVYNKSLHGTGFADAHLTFGGRRHLGWNWQKKNISYSFGFKHGHKRKFVSGAFFAQMRNGKKGLFVRKGRARHPIKEVVSSTPADVLSNRENINAVMAETEKTAMAYIEKAVQAMVLRKAVFGEGPPPSDW